MQRVALDLPLEGRQCFADGLDGEVRQGQRQVTEGYARLVGGFDATDGSRRFAGDEVADQLRRGFIVAAAQYEREGFQALLQLDAGQWAARIIHFRGDADDDAGVGVALVTRVLAHAIGHHPVVVGGAEFRVPGILAKTRAVDQRLWVFDTEADGERLGFHEHTSAVEHAEGIAGAVPEGQDHMPRVELFAAVEDHAGQLAVVDQQVGDALLEAHFTTQGLDFLAHVLDHAGQAEGTDVRLADVENLLRRAGLDELVQDFATVVVRVLDLAVELAVGEGPGTAFAELHVGFGVEYVLAPQAPGVLGTLANFLAAFEDDRLEAHLRQQQTGEDAAGAEADHDRPLTQVGRRLADHLVADIRGHIDVVVVGELFQQGFFVPCRQVDGVDEQHFGRFLAGVVAALEQGEVQQVIAGDAQALDDG